jgi:phosphate starvation-inducible PhoH-like protein
MKLQPTKTHDCWEQALRDKHMMPAIGYGCAGTGKTYGAVGAAVEWLHHKNSQVIITRPNVAFADEIGFLPGNEREKAEPWIRPIQQNLNSHGVGKAHQEDLEKRGKLQYQTMAFVQGLTWDNSFILVDECQNLTYEQIKMLFTRVGNFSKLVLCGDVSQVSPTFENSGLAEWLQMVKHFELPFHTIHFTRDDIMRGPVCKQTIIACEDWEALAR